MATLGYSTIAPIADSWSVNDLITCGPWRINTSGQAVQSISIYKVGSAAGDEVIRLCVYNHSSGPSSLLCYSEQVTVPASAAGGWYTGSSLTGTLDLVSGSDYWIGYEVDTGTGGAGAQDRTESVADIRDPITSTLIDKVYKTGAGGSGSAPPPSTFPGSPSTAATETLSIYLTYGAAAAGGSLLYDSNPRPIRRL